MYYLLSAKAAYAGETAMEKLMAHQNEPIPSLQDVQTTVPKRLDEIFKRMVAKQAADRYQSMSEVIAALQGLGLSGVSSVRSHELASAMSLTAADRQKLGKSTSSKSALTKAVTSEKSRDFMAKVIGGTFVTIIAPILVTFLIKFLEKDDAPPSVSTSAVSTPAPARPAAAPTSVASSSTLNPVPASPPAAPTSVASTAPATAAPSPSVASPNIAKIEREAPSAAPATPVTPAVASATTSKRVPSPPPVSPPAAPPAQTAAPATPLIPSKALTYKGHRYLLVTELLQWNGAKAEAEAMGGHLATITSRAELEWVQKNIVPQVSEDQKRFYIGGTLSKKDASWEWVTGEAFSMDLWLGKVPEGRGTGAKVITWWGSRWDDVSPTSAPHPFLVEWDTLGPSAKSAR